MIDAVDRLKIKSALRDEAFWVAILPLAASIHPATREWVHQRWELVLVLIGYLAHNGYLRGRAVKGAAEAIAFGQHDYDEYLLEHVDPEEDFIDGSPDH